MMHNMVRKVKVIKIPFDNNLINGFWFVKIKLISTTIEWKQAPFSKTKNKKSNSYQGIEFAINPTVNSAAEFNPKTWKI